MNNIVVISKSELVEIIQETLKSQSKEPETHSFQNEFLSIKEASKFLDMATQTIYGMTSTRQIPFIKKGKRVFFNKAEIIAWLNEGKMKTRDEILKGGFK
jgi:excisionase family DNA binding protein